MAESFILFVIRLLLAIFVTYFMMKFISIRIKDIKFFMKNHKALNVSRSFYAKRIILSLTLTAVMIIVLITFDVYMI